MSRFRPFGLVVLSGLAVLASRCSDAPKAPPAHDAARGRALVQSMSRLLAAAPSFSVTTREVRDRTKADGARVHTDTTRDIVIRRPDRFYFTATGDRHNEAWYDGHGLTLVMHDQKVYGQAHLPETLDRAIDAILERYGVALPVGDFLYSDPGRALLTETMTGGWIGNETAGGVATDQVRFQDATASWKLWLQPDRLPAKFVVDFADPKGPDHVEVTFTKWNLTPQIPGDRFDPTVPAGYEGIAIIQRSAILLNMAKEGSQDTSKP
jgi:hypothetical protein